MVLADSFYLNIIIGDEWENIKDITYNVVEEQVGRGKIFDQTLARALQVAGVYMVRNHFNDYIHEQDISSSSLFS